jgi:hypothetical protein
MMTLNEDALKTGVPKEFILERLAVGEVDPRVPLREARASETCGMRVAQYRAAERQK